MKACQVTIFIVDSRLTIVTEVVHSYIEDTNVDDVIQIRCPNATAPVTTWIVDRLDPLIPELKAMQALWQRITTQSYVISRALLNVSNNNTQKTFVISHGFS